jgi:protein-S-isoprenylcysteine O-methyltransferase Ste14
MNRKKLKKMTGHSRLKRAGIRYIFRIHILLFIQAIIFFYSAGRLDIPRAWLFFGIGSVYYPVSTAVIYRKNPDLINQRGENRRDTKSWDKILAPLYFLIGYVLTAALAGMDVGRFHWTYLGPSYMLAGIFFYIMGGIVNTWAMITNPHFESTVRIQKERDHAVITTGPYQYIRHPGYGAGIIWTASIPLIIGSAAGFIAGITGIIILLLRTYLEDHILQKELPGYTEYTQKITKKLLPYIW